MSLGPFGLAGSLEKQSPVQVVFFVYILKKIHSVKFSSLNDIRDNRKDLHYNLQLILMMSNHPLVIVLHMCRKTFTCIHINAELGEFIFIVYVYR